MKKPIQLLLPLLILSLACGVAWPLSPAPSREAPGPTIVWATTQAPINTIVATISPTAKQVLVRYENVRYGYAISHPSSFMVNAVSDEYVELGDQITISVNTQDPETFVGDGPVVESVSYEAVAGEQARVLRGYIGSIGGYIPQQFITYEIQRNGLYYSFTQYALGLHIAEGDISQIAPLNAEDINDFIFMMGSLQFQ